MVLIEKIKNSNYLISLSPNSSLVGVYRIIFLASITFVCGGIAITFYFVGASLILPFAGIELTVLFIAFYLSFKWSNKKEKIYISQETVKIEKGTNKAEYLWEEFRTFTSFQIKKEKELIKSVTSLNRGTSSERELILGLLKNGIPKETIFHDLMIKKNNNKFIITGKNWNNGKNEPILQNAEYLYTYSVNLIDPTILDDLVHFHNFAIFKIK